MISYFNASWKLTPGTRVRLTEQYGDYPLTPIPGGETGTVTINGLSDPSYPCLFVKLDTPYDQLDQWDNELEITGPGAYDDAKPYDADDTSTHVPWHKTMPIEVIT